MRIPDNNVMLSIDVNSFHTFISLKFAKKYIRDAVKNASRSRYEPL